MNPGEHKLWGRRPDQERPHNLNSPIVPLCETYRTCAVHPMISDLKIDSDKRTHSIRLYYMSARKIQVHGLESR